MASIEQRTRGDGTVAFRVVWRDPPPHLGLLPVKALTWQQVTLWIRELQTKGPPTPPGPSL